MSLKSCVHCTSVSQSSNIIRGLINSMTLFRLCLELCKVAFGIWYYAILSNSRLFVKLSLSRSNARPVTNWLKIIQLISGRKKYLISRLQINYISIRSREDVYYRVEFQWHRKPPKQLNSVGNSKGVKNTQKLQSRAHLVALEHLCHDHRTGRWLTGCWAFFFISLSAIGGVSIMSYLEKVHIY